MKQVIYETKGRAREFSELAINLFAGCGHRCIYCYGADATHQDKEGFESHPVPRVTPIDVMKSATGYQLMREKRRILLCFVTDPYQEVEQETQLTRQTIEILHKNNLNVTILTKGGIRSMRDLDLLTPKDAYATTLTCLWDKDSVQWEPKAALPMERVAALIEAHKRGIETWVSFEPVIDPNQTKGLLKIISKVVGHVKIGTMNYVGKLPSRFQEEVSKIDWYNYGWEIKQYCDALGVRYYFKNDLLKHMGVAPEKFTQTFVCR